MHQLRVGAVAKHICDSLKKTVDTRTVVLASLFHDMGNIIKYDFSMPFLDDDAHGIPHWRAIQKEFIEQYGTDEHSATKSIIKEIGLSDDAMRTIDAFGFSKLEAMRESGRLENKIAEYADLRVAPTGVVSLDTRIEEGRARYLKRMDHTDYGMTKDESKHQVLLDAAHEVERQIFALSSIKPEDITDESVQATVNELRSYAVTGDN
ncbi:MAG TPA: HD domain-containing protein [Candidatus Paceibacterota bacterium]